MNIRQCKTISMTFLAGQTDAQYHNNFRIQLEQTIEKIPEAIFLNILAHPDVEATHPEFILNIDSILQNRNPAIKLITHTQNSLTDSDALLWLCGDFRKIAQYAKIRVSKRIQPFSEYEKEEILASFNNPETSLSAIQSNFSEQKLLICQTKIDALQTIQRRMDNYLELDNEKSLTFDIQELREMLLIGKSFLLSSLESGLNPENDANEALISPF